MLLHLPAIKIITAFLLAMAIGTVVTFFVRNILNKHNLVRKATSDRWHKIPVPLFGGIGMFVAFITASLLFAEWNRAFLVLAGVSSIMFFTGLIDDMFKINPPSKLIAQIVAATLVVVCGYTMHFTGNTAINMAITLFIIICLTNAFNLLDNMDGLSAGVAFVVVAIRGAFFMHDGDMQGMVLSAVLLGAIGGFLVFNIHPASIFMGDCGSLFLGFSITSLFVISSTSGDNGFERNVLWLLLLAIPMIDTFFVSITRKIEGRKISQGGRDHLSHRLVKAGLSEFAAVALLWALAAGIGLIAFYIDVTKQYAVALFLFTCVGLFAVLFGRYLAKPEKGLGARPGDNSMNIIKIFHSFKYKRYYLQIIIDLMCIAGAWYLSYLLRFGDLDSTQQMHNMIFSVFIVAASVLLFLGISGVYHGTWRFIDVADVVNIYRGIVLGTICAIFFLSFTFRFTAFSRGVVIINAILLMVLLPMTRASYKLFDELLFRMRDKRKTKKVLIYGAGHIGEMLVRSMRDQRMGENYSVIGFIDDDPGVKLNSILGAKVLGTLGDVERIITHAPVDEILIASSKIPEENVRRIAEMAAKIQGLRVFRQEYTIKRSEILFPKDPVDPLTDHLPFKGHLLQQHHHVAA